MVLRLKTWESRSPPNLRSPLKDISLTISPTRKSLILCNDGIQPNIISKPVLASVKPTVDKQRLTGKVSDMTFRAFIVDENKKEERNGWCRLRL